MNLGSPAFMLYFVVPAALYFLIVKNRKSKEALRNSLFGQEARELFFGKGKDAAPYIICIAYIFFGIALIRPQFGYHEIMEERIGQDIAFVVDVSQSMLAKDLSPNRLGRVRFAITDLVSHLRGDRVGLISFAGVSFIESPLTYDYSTFRLFLDDLSPDLIPVPGTNIESALKRSIQLFGGKEKKFIAGRDKSVILFSDGEELSGNLNAIAKELKELGIKVYAVGIGSEIGAPIPTEKGYKRDKAGKVVLSKLDRQSLEKLAADTDGAYLGGELTGKELERFFLDKVSGQKERSKVVGGVIRVWKEYYQVALFLGLVLYFLSTIGRRKAATVLGLLVLLSPNLARADSLQEADSSFAEGNFRKALELFQSAEKGQPPYSAELGSAKSLYKLKRFSESKKKYLGLLEKERKPEFLYNLGNSQTQLGEYQEAIESYQEALSITPNDQETKDNLEYVKKLLKQENNDSQSNSSQNSQSQSSNSQQSQGGGGGGGGQSSNHSSNSNQNSQNSEQSSESGQGGSSSASSNSASGGSQGSASSENSSSNSSSKSDGKSGQASSSSQTSAEGGQAEQSSESSLSSLSGEENGSPSDREEMLYDSVQEDRGAVRKYRQQKAIEELEENQESPPERDW